MKRNWHSKKNKYKYKELIKRAHKDYPKWIWDEEPREEYNFEKITNFKDELLVLNIFKESTVLGKIENIEKTNIEKYYPKYGYNIFFQPSWNSENPLERIICKRTFVYEVYEFSTMNRIATFCSETNLFKEKFGAKYQLQKTLSGKELFKFFDNKNIFELKNNYFSHQIVDFKEIPSSKDFIYNKLYKYFNSYDKNLSYKYAVDKGFLEKEKFIHNSKLQSRARQELELDIYSRYYQVYKPSNSKYNSLNKKIIKDFNHISKELNHTLKFYGRDGYDGLKNDPDVYNYFDKEFNELEINMENLEIKNKPTVI